MAGKTYCSHLRNELAVLQGRPQASTCISDREIDRGSVGCLAPNLVEIPEDPLEELHGETVMGFFLDAAHC
jgi:hypothetical protein